MKLTIVTLVVALGARLSSAELAPIEGGPDPYNRAQQYNTFPWHFEADRTFIMQTGPVSSPPTNTPAYSGLPLLPGFTGGTGYLGLLHYSKSPIGAYNELMYSPGRYAPAGCSATSVLNSVHRIWVDSTYSQAAGRNIWGIPKEIAVFEWTQHHNGMTSVKVKDPATNSTFFQATFLDLPVPRFLINKGTTMFPGLFPNCLTTLQWPIDDNTGRTPHADVPAYQIAQQAKATTPMSMLQSTVCFSLKEASVTKVLGAWMDPVTFTGRSTEKLGVIPVAFKLPARSPATLTAPSVLKC